MSVKEKICKLKYVLFVIIFIIFHFFSEPTLKISPVKDPHVTEELGGTLTRFPVAGLDCQCFCCVNT